MATLRTRPWLVGVTALGLVAAAAATTSLAASAAESMTRVSEGTGGVQSNGFSGPAVISGDGRYVAFTSAASNLTANDTDTRADVFVRDRVAGTTELVSVGTGGIAGGGTVDDISADGRYVVFTSSAADLVANDFNGVSDVFLRDRVLGTTERVSVTDDERQAQQASTDGSVTRDGRSVTFSTLAPLGVGDADFSSQDVYVRDRTAGTTELVSVTRKGAAGGGKQPTITDGGRFISFTSKGKTLVKDDRNKQEDVFVRDLQKNRTERVSVSSKGEEAGKRSFESQIAGQGRYVVFTSAAGNLVKNDRNRKIDVFVHDRNKDKTQIASVDNSGKTAGGPSVSASISADGRFVLFSSAANLRRGGGTDALYLRDRSAGRTTPIASGVGTGAVLSGSGHELSLLASRANVVPGDTNGVTDVFVYTW